jgi:hypothetical protein
VQPRVDPRGGRVPHHDRQLVHDDGRAEVGHDDRCPAARLPDVVGQVLDEGPHEAQTRERVVER